MSREMREMRLVRGRAVRAEWDSYVDPSDGRQLREQLVAAVERDGEADPDEVIGQFVLEHREPPRGAWRSFTAAS